MNELIKKTNVFISKKNSRVNHWFCAVHLHLVCVFSWEKVATLKNNGPFIPNGDQDCLCQPWSISPVLYTQGMVTLLWKENILRCASLNEIAMWWGQSWQCWRGSSCLVWSNYGERVMSIGKERRWNTHTPTLPACHPPLLPHPTPPPHQVSAPSRTHVTKAPLHPPPRSKHCKK